MSAEQQQQSQQTDVAAAEPSTHQPTSGGLEATTAKEGDEAKVFFGNLSYTTDEPTLLSFITSTTGFPEAQVSVELVTRFGKRSAGFAFATFGDRKMAEEAVEKLNKLVLDDRELTVAFKSSDSSEPREKKPRRKSKKSADGAEESAEPAAENAAEGAAKKSKSKRAKRPARRLPGDGDDLPEGEGGEVDGSAEGETTTEGAAGRRKRAPRRRRGKGEGQEEGAEEARIDGSSSAPAPAARERKPRGPRTVATGEPSKTLLFVANLPFSLDDKGLESLFSNLDISVKSAKVVTKPSHSSKYPPRSKGFGFVEVANEEQQKAAVEKLQGFKIEDREVTVKVANERVTVEEGAAEVEAVPAAVEANAV